CQVGALGDQYGDVVFELLQVALLALHAHFALACVVLDGVEANHTKQHQQHQRQIDEAKHGRLPVPIAERLAGPSRWPGGRRGASRGSELGRTGPGVGGNLLWPWAYRPLVKEAKRRRRPRRLVGRQMARGAGRATGPRAQKLLDQAILKRMETDDHETPTCLQGSPRSHRPPAEPAKLALNWLAKALEGSRPARGPGNLFAPKHAP